MIKVEVYGYTVKLFLPPGTIHGYEVLYNKGTTIQYDCNVDEKTELIKKLLLSLPEKEKNQICFEILEKINGKEKEKKEKKKN